MGDGEDTQPRAFRTPPNSEEVPRFAGFATFGRAPRLDEVERVDVGILGVPFDSGVSYRPGARFGPAAIREASRLIQGFNQFLDVAPFDVQQVADLGDVTANPFKIEEALTAVDSAAASHLRNGTKLISLGGDHTIALPLLRAMAEQHGPVALIHFDAHLDTWDTYFGAPFTHGTPFLRAFEEGLLRTDALMHVGTRASLHHAGDLDRDERIGFQTISAIQAADMGHEAVARALIERVGDAPVYISLDIDVLDPSHAPGTGTPESGGMNTRELIAIIRGLRDLNIVGADVVEVAPAYDWAQVTALAAANLVYEFISIFGYQRTRTDLGGQN